MTHKVFWFQGRAPYAPITCDGKSFKTRPKSKRIAHEYTRGYFTLTNVLNPNIFYDDYGVETPLKKELADVKVDDYLWLVLVPPKHRVLDVFVYNEVTTTEHSSLQSMGGFKLELVTGIFRAPTASGDYEVSNEQNYGVLAMPEDSTAKEQFLVGDYNLVNGVDEWLGVGVKVNAMPDGRTLADIVGKIVVGAHALDYDAQTFM